MTSSFLDLVKQKIETIKNDELKKNKTIMVNLAKLIIEGFIKIKQSDFVQVNWWCCQQGVR